MASFLGFWQASYRAKELAMIGEAKQRSQLRVRGSFKETLLDIAYVLSEAVASLSVSIIIGLVVLALWVGID
jgi:hypothetical protein